METTLNCPNDMKYQKRSTRKCLEGWKIQYVMHNFGHLFGIVAERVVF
jgi:hypothetical protein